ncbi:MAG TPA: hypothetical protein P5081_07065 [Phycisphaerae bacterium]|nr:hypothetical protein [Phycisphaerae bacterium]HRW52630.1 hypothetical protein [Phycisphaerae bacterium]
MCTSLFPAFAIVLLWPVSASQMLPASDPEIVGPVRRVEQFDSCCGVTPAFQDHVDEIRREIAACDRHRWAGDYVGKGGLAAEYLTIAPNAGCAYQFAGSLGTYVQKWGVVSEDEESLIHIPFEPEWSDVRRDANDVVLIPVTWGAMRLLIRPSEIGEFCDDAHRQRAESRGDCEKLEIPYLQTPNQAIDYSILPTIPEAYKPYLITRTLHANITRVVESRVDALDASEDSLRCRKSRVVIDAGRKDGLLVGSVLEVVEPAFVMRRTLKLTRVEDECAEGVIHELITSDDRGEPTTEWKLVAGPRESGSETEMKAHSENAAAKPAGAKTIAEAREIAVDLAMRDHGFRPPAAPVVLWGWCENECRVDLDERHVISCEPSLIIVVSNDGSCRPYPGGWGLPDGVSEAARGKARVPRSRGGLRKFGGVELIAKNYAIQSGLLPTDGVIQSEEVEDGWLFLFTPGRYLNQPPNPPAKKKDAREAGFDVWRFIAKPGAYLSERFPREPLTGEPFMIHVDRNGNCRTIEMDIEAAANAAPNE